MPIKTARLTILGVVITGLTAGLITLNMPDFNRQHHVMKQLRVLQAHEANLTRDVLLINNGEATHYKSLATTLDDMQQAFSIIVTKLHESRRAWDDKDLALLEKYDNELRRLDHQIEIYQSENAALMVSRHALFNILERLSSLKATLPGDQRAIAQLIESCILHALIDSGIGMTVWSSDHHSHLLDDLRVDLNGRHIAPVLQKAVKGFSFHVDRIVQSTEPNRALTRQILEGDYLTLSDELELSISAWRIEVDRYQTYLNYTLVAAGLFGSGIIFFLFGRMSRLTRRLGEYNSTLESRVQQRTSALERSNCKLEQEIEERRIAERTIQKLAWKDSITGLSNRSFLNEELKHLLTVEKGKVPPLCFLMLDLDGFKGVNDQFGHPVGDALLMEIAQRLADTCQAEDVVARLGGDEFAIIMKNLSDPETMMLLANRLRDVVHQPAVIGSLSVQVGVSIGAVLVPEDATEAQDLMRKADLALYHAKNMGRNQACRFEARLDEDQRERRLLEADLRVALKTGEGLDLAYQPKITISTGEISGLEALFRWNHPERGFIAPDHAITIAEESGLIVDLGLWIMRRAAEQMKVWRQDGYDLGRIWVNVSARQLRQETFINRVQHILGETGLTPNRLGLEITESLEIETEPFLLRRLQQINDAGIELAIDDFGTGYSSLNYLRQLPVSSVKIDKSFVHDMNTCPEDLAIISAAVHLGQALGLPVVAEGVETVTHCEYLCDMGCDEMQGYFFTKPLYARDMTRWITAFLDISPSCRSGNETDWQRLAVELRSELNPPTTLKSVG